MATSAMVRFERKYVVKHNGCWQWTGCIRYDGYAAFRYQGRTSLAHRASYELHVGPVPEGLVLDHLCRNRACVNPNHLEPVTQRENSLRGISFSATNAAKTHCVNGHEFTLENTYRYRGTAGRSCRACNREAARRYAAKKAAT